MLNLEYSRDAAKFLESAEKQVSVRILDRVERLVLDPFPKDVKRVENQWFENEKVFRVRVGDYRILYTVNYSKNRLLILAVDKRARVY